MDDTRPAFGGETEIALARVNTAAALTFAESPYPPVTGDFEIITCTKDVRCAPPLAGPKALPCGYNPAAQLIPAPGAAGSLAFAGLDRAKQNRALAYHGQLCVARLRTRIEDEIVRTVYCGYYTPRIEIHAPELDQEGTVTAEGEFFLFATA